MANSMIRILLLAPSPVLNAYVEELFAQHADLGLAGIERDLDHAIECARKTWPDVVIGDSRETGFEPDLLRLLREGIAPVVIVFDASASRLRLYRSEAWVVKDVEDLEQAIRAEPMLS